MRQKRRYRRSTGFSWKRLLGITQARQEFARKTGIPTTKAGMERKIGSIVTKSGCLIVLIILAVLLYGVKWILEKNGVSLDFLDFLNVLDFLKKS